MYWVSTGKYSWDRTSTHTRLHHFSQVRVWAPKILQDMDSWHLLPPFTPGTHQCYSCRCVCTYTCTHAHTQHTHTCTLSHTHTNMQHTAHTHTRNIRRYAHVCTYADTHLLMHRHKTLDTHTCMQMHMLTHVGIHTHTHAPTHAHSHIHTCAHSYTVYICMHTYNYLQCSGSTYQKAGCSYMTTNNPSNNHLSKALSVNWCQRLCNKISISSNKIEFSAVDFAMDFVYLCTYDDRHWSNGLIIGLFYLYLCVVITHGNM